MTLIKIYFVNTIKATGQEVSRKLADRVRSAYLITDDGMLITIGTLGDCNPSIDLQQICHLVHISPTPDCRARTPLGVKPERTAFAPGRMPQCLPLDTC